VKYLNECWHDLKNNDSTVKYTHHICFWHAVRFIKNAFKNAYQHLGKDKKVEVQKMMMCWCYAFLNASKRERVICRIQQVLILVGSKYKTDLVKEVLAEVTKNTSLLEDVTPNFRDSVPNSSTTIYESSIWGWFALWYCRSLSIEPKFNRIQSKTTKKLGDDDSTSEGSELCQESDDEIELGLPDTNNLETNIYYSENLLRYFLVEVILAFNI